MALTEMSPRTEYLQPHPELTANIIPSIPYLASESGGALLSIGGVLLKKQPVSVWIVDFLSLKHSFVFFIIVTGLIGLFCTATIQFRWHYEPIKL